MFKELPVVVLKVPRLLSTITGVAGAKVHEIRCSSCNTDYDDDVHDDDDGDVDDAAAAAAAAADDDDDDDDVHDDDVP